MITVFTKTVKCLPLLRIHPENLVTHAGLGNRLWCQRHLSLSRCQTSASLQPKENSEKAALQTSFAQKGRCCYSEEIHVSIDKLQFQQKKMSRLHLTAL
jgi:hypothetical protein